MTMIFTTTIIAVDPKDGITKEWSGPRVVAATREEAMAKIADRGYLMLDEGYLVAEIDEETGKKTDFIFWT